MRHPDQKIMRQLIEYTRKKSENPITGCFVVEKNKIISKAVSTVEKTKDPTAHGEMNAIRKICRKQKNYHLKDCWIYSTQIPCPMCASAIVWTQAKGVVWGWDGRFTWKKLGIDPKTIFKTSQKKIEVFGSFLEEESLKIKGYKKNRNTKKTLDNPFSNNPRIRQLNAFCFFEFPRTLTALSKPFIKQQNQFHKNFANPPIKTVQFLF